MANNKLIDAIDSLLPQTQCGLCGYKGCRPYAEAIVLKGERIDHCLPGGIKTLRLVAKLINQNPQIYEKEMASKAKPLGRAIIRESECIGCTKCIQVCPVDAIIGSSKRMHTILAEECTGCELCLEPCPVDCIDIIRIEVGSDNEQQEKSNHWRERYLRKQKRLPATAPLKKNDIASSQEASLILRKNLIQEAIARTLAKKGKKNECNENT